MEEPFIDTLAELEEAEACFAEVVAAHEYACDVVPISVLLGMTSLRQS
jgi:hypothetical protein